MADMRRIATPPRVLLAALAVTCMVLAAACGSGGSPSSPTVTPHALSMSTGPAPWPAPRNASVYIAAAGLPALSQEQLAYHIHAHVDIFVNGVQEPVPANIGIDINAGKISPLHTHDATGVIHIESADQRRFTLGQFFTEWGVRLGEGCVGSYCAPQTSLHVYVDGQETTTDPTQIELKAHDEIAMVIGTPPASVPDHYDFEPGL